MNHDIGVFTRRRIISPAESYFAVPATVAGATTWDPASKTANVTLSGGNLVLTAGAVGANGEGTRTTTSHTTGKYYSEHTLDPKVGGAANSGIAVIDSSFTVGSTWMGANTHGIFHVSDGNVYTNGASVTVPFAMIQGMVYQIAIDVGNKLLWVNHEDTGWIGTAAGDPVAGTNGISFSSLTGAMYMGIDTEGGTNGTIWTSNFGATAYAYTKPSGYSDW